MLRLEITQKLDEAKLALISINLAMFMRWTEDNCGRTFTWDEAQDIVERILHEENYGKDDLLHILVRAFASDAERTDEFRAKTDFDDQIDGFCEAFGIAKPSAPSRQKRAI